MVNVLFLNGKIHEHSDHSCFASHRILSAFHTVWEMFSGQYIVIKWLNESCLEVPTLVLGIHMSLVHRILVFWLHKTKHKKSILQWMNVSLCYQSICCWPLVVFIIVISLILSCYLSLWWIINTKKLLSLRLKRQ